MAMSAGVGLSAPVAVVGRGPVGMVIALRLAGFGVSSVLIDQLGAEPNPGSKAVVMQRQALEVLRAVGVGDTMLAEGVAWRVSRTFLGERQLTETRMPERVGELPAVLNIAQVRTEQLLVEQVLRSDRITRLFEHRLIGLSSGPYGCELALEGPKGTVIVNTDFAVGADGARSTVRKLAGLHFEGYAHDDVYLINDVVAALPFPEERRFTFGPASNPRGTVLVHPQGPGQWHIDYQLGPQADDAPETIEQARERLSAVLGTDDFDVSWSTAYRFKQLVAERFRAGRVLLAGDAAHLTSPYGARGLNSGLADADNLAWRLAAVLTGAADDSLLDGYEKERRPAALENLRVTGRTARFMSPRTWAQRLRRNVVLWCATRVPATRRWVDSGHFYEPAVYPRGAVASVPRGPVAIVSDVELERPNGIGTVRLADILSTGMTALFVAPASHAIEPTLSAAHLLSTQTGLPSVIVDLSETARAADDTRVIRPVVGAEWSSGAGVDVPHVVVVRPDRYPVAAAASTDPEWTDLTAWYRTLNVPAVHSTRSAAATEETE